MAVNPGDDFQGYMEEKEAAAQEVLDYEARLERHRVSEVKRTIALHQAVISILS